MLAAGTYKLTRDVKNPKPDRRKKDDWSAWEIWKAGTEFLVVERSRDTCMVADELPAELSPEVRAKIREAERYATIRMVGVKFSILFEIGPGDGDRYRLLVDALEPCPESIDALIERLDARTNYFVEWLLKSGRLPAALFEKLWNEFRDDGELEGSEWPRQTSTRLVEAPSGLSVEHRADLQKYVDFYKGQEATYGDAGWPMSIAHAIEAALSQLGVLKPAQKPGGDGCTDPDDEHAACTEPCGLVGCDPKARRAHRAEPVCSMCHNPLPADGAQRECRGRTGGGYCR